MPEIITLTRPKGKAAKGLNTVSPGEGIVIFDDEQLQACFERNFAEVAGASEEVRQVRALIAVHELFHMLEGPHSSKVHETIWHLLLPKLRPSLRA